MDKKRLKIALVVLNTVKSRFLETNEFIDSTLKEECKKEKITADEVILFASKLVKKHFCLRFGTIVIIFLFTNVERCGR